MFSNQRHTFHLVDPSPWPLVGGFSAFILTNGAVMYFHSFSGGDFVLTLGFILVLSEKCSFLINVCESGGILAWNPEGKYYQCPN